MKLKTTEMIRRLRSKFTEQLYNRIQGKMGHRNKRRVRLQSPRKQS